MKNNFVFKLICYGAYFVCRLFCLTYRCKYTGVENLHKALTIHPQGGFVLACWHEYALPGILAQAGNPYCLLVSSSRDGELINFVCQRIGQSTVRGSSTRGGLAARNQLLKIIPKGFPAAITVDGPKGPRRKCKPGAVDLARQTGVPIVPIGVSFHNPWIFTKSWDQTKIPKFFSKVIFRFGEPILVPSNINQDEFAHIQILVEESLNRLVDEASQDLLQWKQLPSRKKDIGVANKV